MTKPVAEDPLVEEVGGESEDESAPAFDTPMNPGAEAEDPTDVEVLPAVLLDGQDLEWGLRVGKETLLGMSGTVRRAMAAGLKTVLTADDRIKDTLPGEMAAYVARQSEVVRAEILKAVGRQTRLFLKELDLQKELRELLSDMRVEITTQVRVLPKERPASTGGPEVVVRSGDEEQSLEASALAPLVESLARSLAKEWASASQQGLKESGQDAPVEEQEESRGSDVD